MRKFSLFILVLILFDSCETSIPGFRFSNFKSTPAENLAKAVKNNNIKKIRNEVINKKIDIDFRDPKYGVTLLSLAVINNKKEAFNELLKLGANPNSLDYTFCDTPLINAITYNYDCDLYYIKKLINSGAEPNKFNDECYDILPNTPLTKAINRNKCIDIVKLLTKKIKSINLKKYNNSENYEKNIIYSCLDSKNMEALKYFVIDLKLEFPNKIYYVSNNFDGFLDLETILKKDLNFTYSKKKNAIKNEILNFIDKNGNDTD